MAIPTHPCTAWCADPDHVDLVHFNRAAWSDAEIVSTTEADYAAVGVSVTVTKIEPAPEAPDRSHGSAHLVWWRYKGLY